MLDYTKQLERVWPAEVQGSVTATDGVAARAAGLPAPVGAEVEIQRIGAPALRAEVVGFRDNATLLFPFHAPVGVRIGDRVRMVATCSTLRVGPQLLGRVLSPLGEPLDRLPRPAAQSTAPLEQPPPDAVSRQPIQRPLQTGVRAIDALLTCGAGQRTAIVAGPGLGKSVLLGMLARNSEADVNVVALIGERGREVQEFLNRDLGDGLSRSVVFVATGDESAALRVRAAMAAMAAAEYFREQGLRVQLLFDSLTRVAMAQREIGLALGELPAARGYPPSVYSFLPRLLERAGTADGPGSITAFYSVLVDEQDRQDPIGEAARGLLDAHLILSPRLAQQGHFPAIDLLDSVSRLMPLVTTQPQLRDAQLVRRVLAQRQQHADLISIGAYQAGTNPEVDVALEMEGPIRELLVQAPEQTVGQDESRRQLSELADRLREQLQ